MLTITIPGGEQFNEQTNEFTYSKGQTITIEHSLASISKWEAKWKKPFYDKEHEKSYEESIDYVRCMTITQNVNPEVYNGITPHLFQQINDYMDNPMTATWFGDDGRKKRPSKEIVTSELIYYWMVALNIPFECQKWHINRLFTLIRICNEKNDPKKLSKNDIRRRNRDLNARRRAAMHTKG